MSTRAYTTIPHTTPPPQLAMTMNKEQLEQDFYQNYLSQPIMGYTVYYNGQYWWSLQQDVAKTKYCYLYVTPAETVGRTL